MSKSTLIFPRVKPCTTCVLAEKLMHVEIKCRACVELFKEHPKLFNKDSCLYGGEDWVEQVNVSCQLSVTERSELSK